jgi:hypothetical protein
MSCKKDNGSKAIILNKKYIITSLLNRKYTKNNFGKSFIALMMLRPNHKK